MHNTMTIPTNEEGRALRAPAETIHRTRDYVNLGCMSRRKLLDEAAEVLCVLSFFPLSVTERASSFALLEQRLRLAYEGVTR